MCISTRCVRGRALLGAAISGLGLLLLVANHGCGSADPLTTLDTLDPAVAGDQQNAVAADSADQSEMLSRLSFDVLSRASAQSGGHTFGLRPPTSSTQQGAQAAGEPKSDAPTSKEPAAGDTANNSPDSNATPQMVVRPDELAFTDASAPAHVQLRHVAGVAENYLLICDQPWLYASATHGAMMQQNVDDLSVWTVPGDLTDGAYAGNVSVVTEDGVVARVAVSLQITNNPAPEPDVCTVSGHVTWLEQPLAGVILESDAGDVGVVTDDSGHFEFSQPNGWSGMLRPRDVNYQFDPPQLELGPLHNHVDRLSVVATRVVPTVPILAVRLASTGKLSVYQGPAPVGPFDANFSYVADFDNAYATVQIRWVGNDQWQLTLTPKVELTEINFPFDLTETALNGDSSDDFFLDTRLFGVAWNNDDLSTGLRGNLYPGAAFAPLVVHSDQQTARMVAAVNWPPLPYCGMLARGRLAGLYRDGDDVLPAVGETFTCRALVTWDSGAPELGVYAWQRNVDKYRNWLIPHLTDAGLYPVHHSDWMYAAHGWMTAQLYSISDAGLAGGCLDYYWDTWGHLFPWFEMWGQTSAYNPSYGCCNYGPEFNARYVPIVDDFADKVLADGGHVGFYARPYEPYDPIDGLTPESQANLKLVTDWLDVNAAHGADAFYIDVLGVRYFGNPLAVANLFLTTFPEDTIIEYAVDMYPTAFSVAASTTGNDYFGSGPGLTDCEQGFDADHAMITYPRFGRYLLNDRLIWHGTSNRGYSRWGAAHEYWQERQVFLMGAKIDVHCGLMEEGGERGTLDRALDLIIAERDRVDWWARRPVYHDRAGLTHLPADVDIRRFVDQNGANLFVIDNWHQVADATFVYDGQEIAVPQNQLSIVELP